MTAEAPTAELASNYCSPRATSNARSSCPGLSDWFCRPDSDDFVLRSLVCSCSNVALRAQGLYCATDSPFIPRACPDCASGCLHISYGKLRDCRTRDLKTSTHLAHGTRKAARSGPKRTRPSCESLERVSARRVPTAVPALYRNLSIESRGQKKPAKFA